MKQLIRSCDMLFIWSRLCKKRSGLINCLKWYCSMYRAQLSVYFVSAHMPTSCTFFWSCRNVWEQKSCFQKRVIISIKFKNISGTHILNIVLMHYSFVYRSEPTLVVRMAKFSASLLVSRASPTNGPIFLIVYQLITAHTVICGP